LKTLEGIQKEFNDAQGGKKKVSLADLIVLGGCAAVEKAAKDGGHNVQVPSRRDGRTRRRSRPDVESFAALEPDADGFRNYIGEGHEVPAEHLLIERAFRLTLSAPEMTALIGGLRALNANTSQSNVGVLTKKPGTLTNDFFVNLLDMSTEWCRRPERRHIHRSRSRKGDARWTASRVDLVFGSNSELRSLSEVYACDDAKEKFVRDFVAAWTKVMNLDRFDVSASRRVGGTESAELSVSV
jgi:catalase-peroxidase